MADLFVTVYLDIMAWVYFQEVKYVNIITKFGMMIETMEYAEIISGY